MEDGFEAAGIGCLSVLVLATVGAPATGAILMALMWMLHGWIDAIPEIGYWRATGITACLTFLIGIMK